MVTGTLPEDDHTETLLISDHGGNISSAASEIQMYRIHSIESTVVIRQLPSQGISFKLWLHATTLVTLLDNYRRDPSHNPISPTLSNFSSPLTIIELGSGTGIVGIVAAATLGANVTVPNVIENFRFNVDANTQFVSRFGAKVHVAPLRWGEVGDVEVLGQNVDLILASDVVYHEHLYDPLLKTLRSILSDAERRVFLLMAHIKRWKKESIFFKKARKLFDVEVIHSDDPQQGSRIGVAVYRFAFKHQKKDFVD